MGPYDRLKSFKVGGTRDGGSYSGQCTPRNPAVNSMLYDGKPCRSDICVDTGNDCCAPDDEHRGCSQPGYVVKPGGTTTYGSCPKEGIYQCCKESVEVDDTCQNISSSRFIQNTENPGSKLIPNAQSVLCKEHACTVENDGSRCCLPRCDSIEDSDAFCNEIGKESGLIKNANMIQCMDNPCKPEVDGVRCCRPTCGEHVTPAMCTAVNRIYDPTRENRACSTFKCQSKHDLEICCSTTCASVPFSERNSFCSAKTSMLNYVDKESYDLNEMTASSNSVIQIKNNFKMQFDILLADTLVTKDNVAGWGSPIVVHNKGCGSYIHMDDERYGKKGGKYSVQECADAVKRLNGKEGCKGSKYFFYENSGHCNCPKDDCTTGPNGNAGGDGKLYEMSGGQDIKNSNSELEGCAATPEIDTDNIIISDAKSIIRLSKFNNTFNFITFDDANNGGGTNEGVKQYHDNPSKSYNGHKAFCKQQGKSLCSQQQLCEPTTVNKFHKTGEKWVPVSNGVDEWVVYSSHDANRNCKLHSALYSPDPHPCHTHPDATRYPDVDACGHQQTFCCDERPKAPTTVRNGDCIFCLWLLKIN